MQRLSWRIARALDRSGDRRPGDKVAILSGNDPVAFGCVFGISRAGAVWCPVNPRNEAAENRDLLDFFDCRCLIFHGRLRAAGREDRARPAQADHAGLPRRRALGARRPFDAGSRPEGAEPSRPRRSTTSSMLAGTGGTTGQPKGVMLTGRNLETMSALTLMSYPFDGRPVYLALAPLTHAAGVLCFPILALGGEIVIMPQAGPGRVPRASSSGTGSPTRSCRRR